MTEQDISDEQIDEEAQKHWDNEWFDHRAFARAVLAAQPSASAAPSLPEGYKLVLVPDETAPNEPDWEECKRQAEVSTGLKVEQHTFSIIKREVRRWIAHKADASATGAPHGWVLVPVEPTEDMHAAAVRTIVRCSGNDDFPPRVYRAMIAAAPTTPAPQPAQGDAICPKCKADINDPRCSCDPVWDAAPVEPQRIVVWSCATCGGTSHASGLTLSDEQIDAALDSVNPAWWDVPHAATYAFARAVLALAATKEPKP